MKAMHPLNEEPYEVSLDNHGCCDGPKTGRFRVLDNVSLPLMNSSVVVFQVGNLGTSANK